MSQFIMHIPIKDPGIVSNPLLEFFNPPLGSVLSRLCRCNGGKHQQHSTDEEKPQQTDYELTGLDHGVGHFRPLSITRQRHVLAYHSTAMSHASLCQVF